MATSYLTRSAAILLCGGGLAFVGCANSEVVSAAEQWVLPEIPAVRIGVVDGDSAYQLDRVVGVLRLSDGRIVVANGGTQELRSGEIAVVDRMAQEIRVFAETGTHQRTIGRRGEGPGEFINIAGVAEIAGDSLDVVDGLNGRVSVFGPAGDFARTFPLPRIERGMAPNVVGWLGDGTLVLSTLAREPVEGMRQVVVYLVDREGRVAGEVGEYPSAPLGRNGLETAFGGAAELAAGDSLIWHGHSSRYELRMLDRTGEVRRIVRLGRAPEAIARADIEMMQEAVRESLERQGANPNLIQRILDTEYATTYPLHGRLLTDRSGNLWVERFRNHLLPAQGPPEWDLFDAEGRSSGSLRLPGGFQLTHAEEDLLLGVHTDSLGVQRVRAYKR